MAAALTASTRLLAPSRSSISPPHLGLFSWLAACDSVCTPYVYMLRARTLSWAACVNRLPAVRVLWAVIITQEPGVREEQYALSSCPVTAVLTARVRILRLARFFPPRSTPQSTTHKVASGLDTATLRVAAPAGSDLIAARESARAPTGDDGATAAYRPQPAHHPQRRRRCSPPPPGRTGHGFERLAAREHGRRFVVGAAVWRRRNGGPHAARRRQLQRAQAQAARLHDLSEAEAQVRRLEAELQHVYAPRPLVRLRRGAQEERPQAGIRQGARGAIEYVQPCVGPPRLPCCLSNTAQNKSRRS